jgi:hypothetical protein
VPDPLIVSGGNFVPKSCTSVDLDAWWNRLGIRKERGRLVFDERAPLAAVRRAITVAP